MQRGNGAGVRSGRHERKYHRNAVLDELIKDRIKREVLLPKERLLAVQLLLKSARRKDDAELFAWLKTCAKKNFK
jgi:hypothetical protein